MAFDAEGRRKSPPDGVVKKALEQCNSECVIFLFQCFSLDVIHSFAAYTLT